MAAYASRTTDLCSNAYAGFSPEAQLSLTVDHVIAGLADLSTREYAQRERAQRTLEWLETVRIAQASEASRLSNPSSTAVAVNAVHDSRAPLRHSLRVISQTLSTRVLVTGTISRHCARVTHEVNNLQTRIPVNRSRYRHHKITRARVIVPFPTTPRRTRAQPT